MKRFLKLVINELFKQYKKIGIVIVSVLLAVYFAVPSISTLLSYSNAFEIDYESQVSVCEQDLIDIDDDKYYFSDARRGSEEYELSREIEKSFIQSQLNVYKNISTLNIISPYDWRHEAVDKVLALRESSTFLKFFIDPKYSKYIMNFSYRYAFPSKDNEINNDYINITDIYDYDISSIKKQSEILDADADVIIEKIRENNTIAHIREQLDNNKSLLDAEQKRKDEFLSKYNPEDENDVYNLKISEAAIKGLEDKIKICNLRIENGINFEDTWENKTISKLNDEIVQRQNNIPYTSKQYHTEINKYSDRAYSQYIDEQKKLEQKTEDNISLYFYSLENEKPLYDINLSTRDMMRKMVDKLPLIIYFCIFIASVIVAKEFGNGTIKMLLIRPVRRSTILFSKLATVFFIAIAALCSLFVLSTASSCIIHGISDLAYPYMRCVEGVVYEQNFIMWTLGALIKSSVSVLFYFSLAFMLSTVTKSVATSIIISIVATGVQSAAISIYSIAELYGVSSVILKISRYIPMFYFDISTFVNSDVPLMRTFGAVSLNIFDIRIGIAWLLLLTFLFVFISFKKFTNQDIKN